MQIFSGHRASRPAPRECSRDNVPALRNRFVENGSGLLDFLNGVVRPVLIEMGDLTKLFPQIAVQVKAECALTATLLQNAEFNLRRCASSRFLGLRHGVRPEFDVRARLGPSRIPRLHWTTCKLSDAYFEISPSVVTRAKSSMVAWAINNRSKGSR